MFSDLGHCSLGLFFWISNLSVYSFGGMISNVLAHSSDKDWWLPHINDNTGFLCLSTSEYMGLDILNGRMWGQK